MARLFGFIGNRSDLGARVLELNASVLRIRREPSFPLGWGIGFFQSGEVLMLPEGEGPASVALARFARMDQSAGLLGRGFVSFDLRNPNKTMTVRLPRKPGEPIVPEPVSES